MRNVMNHTKSLWGLVFIKIWRFQGVRQVDEKLKGVGYIEK